MIITHKKIKGFKGTETCYNIEFTKKLEGYMFANAEVLCSYVGNDISIMEKAIPKDGILKLYALGKFMEIDVKAGKLVKATLVHYDENTMYKFINETRSRGFGRTLNTKEGFKELRKVMGKMDGATDMIIDRLHEEEFIKEVRAIGAPGL